jgi:hypothetical protein
MPLWGSLSLSLFGSGTDSECVEGSMGRFFFVEAKYLEFIIEPGLTPG